MSKASKSNLNDSLIKLLEFQYPKQDIEKISTQITKNINFLFNVIETFPNTHTLSEMYSEPDVFFSDLIEKWATAWNSMPNPLWTNIEAKYFPEIKDAFKELESGFNYSDATYCSSPELYKHGLKFIKDNKIKIDPLIDQALKQENLLEKIETSFEKNEFKPKINFLNQLIIYAVCSIGELVEASQTGSLSSQVIEKSPAQTGWHSDFVFLALATYKNSHNLNVLDIISYDEKQVNVRTSELNVAMKMGYYIGVAYRDRWWIDNHGDAAIKGYLDGLRLDKAGESATATHSEARAVRIKVFLEVHAKMMAENPLLRDDPEADTAHRALKLAKAKEPTLMKQSKSKKTALEYWEYIKSDEDLLVKYSETTKAYASKT